MPPETDLYLPNSSKTSLQSLSQLCSEKKLMSRVSIVCPWQSNRRHELIHHVVGCMVRIENLQVVLDWS